MWFWKCIFTTHDLSYVELLCKFFVTAMIVNYIFRLKDKAALFLKENFLFKEFKKKIREKYDNFYDINQLQTTSFYIFPSL